MTTGFEVSQLQTNLSDARSRELNALVIYRKAVASYHDAIADILDWKGIRVDGLPQMQPPPPPDASLARIREAVSTGVTAAP